MSAPAGAGPVDDRGQSVGVLLPLRLETRYRRPERDGDPWALRLRVVPDPVATVQPPSSPSWAEALAVADYRTSAGDDPDGEAGRAAWAALAGAYGGPRAAYLLRAVALVDDGTGTFAPTGGETDYRPPRTGSTLHRIALPELLQVWGERGAGPELLGELRPDLDAISDQTDFAKLAQAVHDDPQNRIPDRWWTSYAEALRVRLAGEFNLGVEPALRWLAVTGLADPAAPLPFAALAAEGRLGVLEPLTPTNTVAGSPVADLGDDPEAWRRAAAPVPDSEAAELALALTGQQLEGIYTPPRDGSGRIQATRTLVRALWPVLWQRMLKDVADTGEQTWDIGAWAGRELAPLGPFPTLRVDDLPYGVLPVTDLAAWRPDPADPPFESGLRDRLLTVLPAWAAVAEAGGTATGADAGRLLDLLGSVPVSRQLGARLVMPVELRVLLSQALGEGDPLRYLEQWRAWAEPWRDLGIDPLRRHWPFGRALATVEGGEPLRESLDLYLGHVWEVLAYTRDGTQGDPGLLARLLRHALLLVQAEVNRLDPERAPSWRPPLLLPLDRAEELAHLAQGGDQVLQLPQFALDGVANGEEPLVRVVDQFESVAKAVRQIHDEAEAYDHGGRLEACLSAVVDTASHRLDPWATALATARLRRLSAAGVGRRLGAYGWVDDLQPSQDATPPTTAGLLHAPSHAQALTAAVLRDRAIATDDDTWSLQIDSDSARLAKRLGDDVRIGIGLAEAIGREVERRAGEPGRVVDLRRAFPARPEWAGRRVCDGLQVLEAAATGQAPAWLPALDDLQAVIDTYGDLLVADAVHDVVSGRGGQAAEAMEAAAGLAAPAELRMLRTQREGTTVRSTVLVALEPAEAPAGSGPATVADPMAAALFATRVPAETWTYRAGDATVSLADLGLATADALVAGDDRLQALATSTLGAPVDGGTFREARAALDRLAGMLGPQEGVPAVLGAGPGSDGGAGELRSRLVRLIAEAADVLTALSADPPNLTPAVAWGLAAAAGEPPAAEAAAVLADRLSAATAAATDPVVDAAGLAAAIRALLVPVSALPLVCSANLPVLPVPLEDTWLEVVAAVRPAMARLEAVQLEAGQLGGAWPAAASAPPWEAPQEAAHHLLAFGPAVGGAHGLGPVGAALIDDWGETVPSTEHATWAAFGYDSPRARAPQAVLLAVPPDPAIPLEGDQLLGIVLAARELARVRMVRPGIAPGDGLASWQLGAPTSLLLATGPAAAEVVR